VEIRFFVSGTPVTLTRDWLLGGMKLVTARGSIWLQHPLNPFTHFSFSLTKSWKKEIDGHTVVVEKSRPMLAAGLRQQSYMVYVNGELVATSTGY